MKRRALLSIFNRGRISRLALARLDVSRVALSAAIQTNWVPRTLGSMSLRPGLEYVGGLQDDGALVPFVFASDDTALLELTPDRLRIWDNGDTPLVRSAVTARITNFGFGANIDAWTDGDDTGAVSEWAAGGFMSLTGTGYGSARRTQQVSITEQDTVHGLRVLVKRGPVLIRIGTTSGGDDVFRQAVLRTGAHSLAFTPGAASIYIEFTSTRKYSTLIDYVQFEGAGVVSLPTPWADAETIKSVRWQQEGDVVFCACEGIRQRRIERRPNNSWSVVEYTTSDGPFLGENTENLLLTPSGLSGEVTLTASRSLFRSDHVGSLFRLSSQGQRVESDLAASNTFSNSVRVTGVGDNRDLDVRITGSWSGSVSLQRSIGEEGSWVTVATYSSNTSPSYDDGLDNVIAFYRIGFEAGNYTSGSASVSLEFSGGSTTGVARVTGYTSETEVDAIVLRDFGGTDGTEIWAEGAWSDVNGWPTAVAPYEGRLWWFGGGRAYGSVSDAFTAFDPDTEGDSGPINRRLGEGAVNDAKWALPMQRLLIGTGGGEHAIRSNSFDEPVTPSNYNSKRPSTKGAYDAPAVEMDGRGYFIGRSGDDLYEMVYSAEAYDYAARDVTTLIPEIGEAGFRRLGIQNRPDTRLHAVRADGTVGLLVRDAAEDVLCWVDIETDGVIEDVAVLPGDGEDQVFYRVRRTVGVETVRFLERWAKESECRGGSVNKQADSFISGSGVVTGLSHLAGRDVVLWADGADIGTFPVRSDGSIFEQEHDAWCAGLPYKAQYQSGKLAPETQLGIALTSRSRIVSIGLVLADTHARGLKYGQDFANMDDLPQEEYGETVLSGLVNESYDRDAIEFPGEWGTDARICLEASAPRPATVLAANLVVDVND